MHACSVNESVVLSNCRRLYGFCFQSVSLMDIFGKVTIIFFEWYTKRQESFIFMFERRSEDSSKPEESEGPITRRHFLRSAGVGFGALALTILAGEKLGSRDEVPTYKHTKREPRETWETSFDTGDLAGADMPEGLFLDYFGIEDGKMPEHLTVNFPERLIAMWAKKNERAHHDPKVKATADAILDEYCRSEPTPSSVEQFTIEAGTVVKKVLENINWDAVRMLKGMSVGDVELAQKLLKGVSGTNLTALCMTELMPSDNGRINKSAFDLLLQYAGKEFIESVPALYDSLVSFGPYQFTAHALDGKGQEPVGASIMNVALPERMRIPEEVSGLRGDAHHTAAMLYVIENVCNLINTLKQQSQAETVLGRLDNLAGERPEDVALFLATAHHAPDAAIRTAAEWLEQVTDDDAQTFLALCPPRILKYATRMQKHLEVLHKK